MMTYATQSGPTVFPMVPCKSSDGTEVTIGCLSTDFLPAPVDVTWNSGSITTGIKNLPAVLNNKGSYMSSSYLTISASDWKSEKYTCNVTHKSTSTVINKDVPKHEIVSSPRTVEVMLSSCGINNMVELVCLINGYTSASIKVKWLQDGKDISSVQYTNYQYGNVHDTFTSSKLSVPKQDWDKGTVYTCEMTHAESSTTERKLISKCPDSTSIPMVVLHPPSRKDLLITQKPKLTCEVTGITSKALLKIIWKRSDGNVPSESSTVLSESFNTFANTYNVNSTLRISKGDWQAQVSFTCIITFDEHSSPIEQSIQNTKAVTREPTIYIFPPARGEMIYDFVGITCRLEDFDHKDIYVEWKMNNKNIKESEYINTEPILTDDGKTYIMFSKVLVSKSEWMRKATFTCLGGIGRITGRDITIKTNRQ